MERSLPGIEQMLSERQFTELLNLDDPPITISSSPLSEPSVEPAAHQTAPGASWSRPLMPRGLQPTNPSTSSSAMYNVTRRHSAVASTSVRPAEPYRPRFFSAGDAYAAPSTLSPTPLFPRRSPPQSPVMSVHNSSAGSPTFSAAGFSEADSVGSSQDGSCSTSDHSSRHTEKPYSRASSSGQTSSAMHKPRRPRERTHECQICGRRFSRPSSLALHVNTHTGHKPFACPFPSCGRPFSVSSNMRRHYKSHSRPTDPMPPQRVAPGALGQHKFRLNIPTGCDPDPHGR